MFVYGVSEPCAVADSPQKNRLQIELCFIGNDCFMVAPRVETGASFEKTQVQKA